VIIFWILKMKKDGNWFQPDKRVVKKKIAITLYKIFKSIASHASNTESFVN
tara:strand:- start:89 stop:241 length:153 start_codon:yes stop_codon:yes gene_type:complete